MEKKIPIGVDDFLKLISKENNFLFVDKSLFIKEFLDNSVEVSLIMRPRRWGKTLNMSMLKYFFAPEVNGHSTQGLFDGLAIAKEAEGAYLKHQGSHPVILISFKEVKEDSSDAFFENISELMSELYTEYDDILMNSPKLSKNQKAIFERIIERKSDKIELKKALKLLSKFLENHYNKKVIILIDEYDTPLNAAYHHNYFEKAVRFLKGFLGSGLKGNDALEKGVLTGVLRVSKNSMLSDLNNLKLYSLVDAKYSEFFGFSESEVKYLFSERGLHFELASIQKWYNGYRSGDLVDIYNPWSILNCIDDKGSLKPYWVMTADDAFLKEAMGQLSSSVEDKLTTLLEDGSIESSLDDYVSFGQIKQYGEEALWSLLWATGYLKWVEKPRLSALGKYTGFLKIPNEEVSYTYRSIFPQWVRAFNRGHYDSFLKNLVYGNVEAFIQSLRSYVLSVPSWFDFQRESDYHAFFLGLLSSLEETHKIVSNREVGSGRPDLVLVPKERNNQLGLIMEFKREAQGQSLGFYEECANKAFEQINEHDYDFDLKRQSSITQILKLAIVFYGKNFVYKSMIEDLRPSVFDMWTV